MPRGRISYASGAKTDRPHTAVRSLTHLKVVPQQMTWRVTHILRYHASSGRVCGVCSTLCSVEVLYRCDDPSATLLFAFTAKLRQKEYPVHGVLCEKPAMMTPATSYVQIGNFLGGPRLLVSYFLRFVFLLIQYIGE